MSAGADWRNVFGHPTFAREMAISAIWQTRQSDQTLLLADIVEEVGCCGG
jgi:hypothetical protein